MDCEILCFIASIDYFAFEKSMVSRSKSTQHQIKKHNAPLIVSASDNYDQGDSLSVGQENWRDR